MAYGFIIQPDNWDRQIDITANARILSNLGRYKITGSNNYGDNILINQQLDRPTTSGQPLVVPTKAAHVLDIGNGKSSLCLLRGATASGSTLSLRSYQYTYAAAPNYIYDLSVFEVPYGQPQSFGIALYDAVDFTAITDVSRFGYVTWKGTVNISGSWDIPQVVNRETCVVFARWENGTTPLYFDRDAMAIRTYTSFGSADGSAIGGTVNNVQILIVSTGFIPPLPASGYGVVIRNGAGQITYSSALPPVIWRGGTVTFPFYIENSTGSGAKVQWNACQGNVAYPMVPLGTYGFQVGDYSTAATYPGKRFLYSGLLMSGNSVSTYRAKPAGASVYYQTYPCRGQMGLTIPVLDAGDYF